MTDESSTAAPADAGAGETPPEPTAPETKRDSYPFGHLFFAIFFALVAVVAYVVVLLLAMLQFLTVAFEGHKNDELQQFSRMMGRYMQHMFEYITLSRDDRPFPLGPFPKS